MAVVTTPNVNGDPGFTNQQAIALAASVQPNLAVVDYVESGLLPPSSGALSQVYPAGAAWINNRRILVPAQSVVFTATRDNYVDLRNDGVFVITPVTIAATAPAIPVNSMRIGFVTTNATNVISRTFNAFDNQGNWMYNVSRSQTCRLRSNTLQGSGGAEISVAFPEADIFDNASLHDPVTNNSRITFPVSGTYFLSCAIAFSAPVTPLSSFTLYARLDGATEEPTFPQDSRGTSGSVINMQTSGFVVVNANQYMEFRFIPNGVAGATLAAAWLQCVRVA